MPQHQCRDVHIDLGFLVYAALHSSVSELSNNRSPIHLQGTFKFFGCILASYLEKHLFASWMLCQEGRYIENFLVYNNPAVFSSIMPSNFFNGIRFHKFNEGSVGRLGT